VNKRPIAVTFIAWLLIAAGLLGFGVHARELVGHRFHFVDLWIPLVDLLPSVFGVFILLGHSWARWLAVAYMAVHVGISFFDAWQKVAVHTVLFGLIAFALFRADARVYFERPKPAAR
jgi:hypothetical protein